MGESLFLTSYSQKLPPMEVSVGVHIPERDRSDKEKLRERLVHFFPDDKSDEAKEQLDSAHARFMDAVEQRGLSPYVAFKEVIRTTALAEKMDTLHGSRGGIDFYIMEFFNEFDVRTDDPWFNEREHLSDASRIEAKNAGMRRKVQEIKRLMAREQTRHVNGSQPVEELQITNGVGQGQDHETEQS